MPDLVPSIPLHLARRRHRRLRHEALCDAEDDLSMLRGRVPVEQGGSSHDG